MKEHFRREGYALVRGMFPVARTRALRREIHGVFRRRLEVLGKSATTDADGMLPEETLYRFFDEHPDDYVGCMRVIQNLHASFALAVHPPLVEEVRTLGIATMAFSTKPIIMLNSPHTGRMESHWKVPPHQDWRSIQGSLNCVVVWIALADVPRARGALEVIPGSHRWGLLESEPDEWYRRITDSRLEEGAFVSVPMNEGDALLFSAFLVHRSGENDGEAIRYSLQFRFNDLAERSFVRRGYPTTYESDRPVRDYVAEGLVPAPEDVVEALDEGGRAGPDDAPSGKAG